MGRWLQNLAILGPVSVLVLRLPLSAAVTLSFPAAVRARGLVQLLISLVHKTGLLRDTAALAVAICPRLTARRAVVLIKQIVIGLYLIRDTFEEPSKGHQIACERRPGAELYCIET